MGPNLIPYLKASYNYSPLFVIIYHLLFMLCNLDDFSLLFSTGFSIDVDLFDVLIKRMNALFKNESYLFSNLYNIICRFKILFNESIKCTQ